MSELRGADGRAPRHDAPGPAPGPARDAAPSHRGPAWARWTASVVLLALAALASIGAVAARYVRADLLDTGRYVATVAPLAHDPDVQAAVATTVTDAIERRLDLRTLTTRALTALTEAVPRVPDAVVGLAPVLANQADTFIANRVTSFVRSDQFATLWTTANRVAHRNLVSVLTGEGGAALAADADGQVSVQLGPVVDAVTQQLAAQGLTFVSAIPRVDASIVVLTSPGLVTAQRWVRFLDHAATWLAWAAVALAVAGVAVAPRGSRRRATVVTGVLVTLAMLVLALGVVVVRVLYLGAVPSGVLAPGAARTVFDTLVQPLRASLRVVLVVALVVAVAGFLVGPSPAAVAVRRGFGRLVGRVSGGRAGTRAGFPAREPRAWEVWAERFRVVLTVAIVAAAALLLAFWHDPTGAVALWIALAAVALVVSVQLVAAPARAAHRPAATPGSPA